MTWKTLHAQNTLSFQLEAARIPGQFLPIASVPAIGSGSNSYHAIDVHIINSLRYYRLKIIDRDGKVDYSQVVIMKTGTPDNGIPFIYPNPATTIINVNSVAGSSPLQVIFYNSAGQVLLRKTVPAGKNAINVSRLPKGQYQLEIQTGNSKYSNRIKIK